MRSAFFIATFALTVFAVPVPEAKPIFKGNGSECVKRIGGKCAIRTRDTAASTGVEIEAQFTDADSQRKMARSPYIRPKFVHPDPESVAETGVEARFAEPNTRNKKTGLGRNKNSRSLGRNKNGRSLGRNKNGRGLESSEEEEEEVQTRSASPFTRHGERSIDTSVTDEASDEELESRGFRGNGARAPSPFTRHGERSLDAVELTDAKHSSQERTVRGGTGHKRDYQASTSKRTAEAEADPEPFTRNHGSYRTRDLESESDEEDIEELSTRYIRGKPARSADSAPSLSDAPQVGGLRTGSNKRTAVAQPVNRIHGPSGKDRHIGQRAPEAMPINRIHG